MYAKNLGEVQPRRTRQLFGRKPQTEAQHASIVLTMVVIRGVFEKIKMVERAAGKKRYLETAFEREIPSRLIRGGIGSGIDNRSHRRHNDKNSHYFV